MPPPFPRLTFDYAMAKMIRTWYVKGVTRRYHPLRPGSVSPPPAYPLSREAATVRKFI